MNLRDLRYIVAVDEQGHFGRAAAACTVSQPTLSGQIAKLEAELGVLIFQRNGRKITPTEAGREILDHARRTLAAAQDITHAARAHRNPLSGRLRLGVIPTIGPYLIPFVLPAAASTLPEAPLSLVEDLTEHLVPQVLEGKLDGAILATQCDAASIKTIDLFIEPFWVATPKNHPLAAKKTIRTQDIDPKTLLLLTDGHCLRDQTLELCQNPHIGESVIADMRATSLETLLHLTTAGYGITLIPQLVMEAGRASDDQFVLRPLVGPGTARTVQLIYRANSPRAKALIELARTIRSAVPENIKRQQS